MVFTGTKRIAGRLAASQIASRIDSVGLATLHVRLDIGWRNQPRVVAKLCDLARPVMSRAAGLHRHKARGKSGEEPQDLALLELLAQNTTPRLIGAVNLKNQLGQVQTNYANLAHGWGAIHRIIPAKRSASRDRIKESSGFNDPGYGSRAARVHLDTDKLL